MPTCPTWKRWRARSRDPSTSYKVIVEKSTVPVYTNEWIRRAIERNGIARDLFDVVSNPEFLREGTAVIGLPAPRPHRRGSRYAGTLRPKCWGHLRPADLGASTTSTRTAIIAGGSARRCRRRPAAEYVDQVGRDHQARVERFSGAEDLLHQRRSPTCARRLTPTSSRWRKGHRSRQPHRPKFLRPGIGYGGSCFPKDVAAFRSVADGSLASTSISVDRS